MLNPNCQSTTRNFWAAEKVITLIRLHGKHSHYFTGNENASRYGWTVIQRELGEPVPLINIIEMWNHILQEYQTIKHSEEPKRREWPYFHLMDAYFGDEVNYPTIQLEDDPVRSSVNTAATSRRSIDIPDMMQVAQSNKVGESNFDYCRSVDVPGSSNTHNNGIRPKSRIPKGRTPKGRTPKGRTPKGPMVKKAECPSRTSTYIPSHHKNVQYLLTGNVDHVCEGLYDLQKAGKMVDVTIIVAGGKLFEAHKLVLSVCSPYFQTIFLQDTSPHSTLFMTGVDSSDMAGLIEFMYTGNVYIPHEDLPKFVKAADSMQIKVFHIESTPNIDESKVSPTPPTQRKESKPNDLNQHVNIPILDELDAAREHLFTELPLHNILNNDSRYNVSNNIAYNNYSISNLTSSHFSTNEIIPSNYDGHKENGYSIILANNLNQHLNIPLLDAARENLFTEPIRSKLPPHDILNNDSRYNVSNNIAYNNYSISNLARSHFSTNENIPSNYDGHKTNGYSIISDNHKYFSKRKMMSHQHEMQNIDKRHRY